MSNSRNKKFANRHLFPIVCVGASAGGLEALIAFFKCLPKTINMAFVLIQHLEPQHKSALSEILSRETSLNIREAENHVLVESAHVYVIPPNTRMTISRRRLNLTSRVKRVDGRYLPIDFFMSSLAESEGENAIGVILSGTGSDGTQGAKVIKAKGGVVFVQNEKTARYFGMPESVIKSGSVDFVLSPREIAKQLAHLSVHGLSHPLKAAVKSLSEQEELKRILVLLRDLTGVDFLHYKQSTIIRRIARQMAFHNLENHADYYHYLNANPLEADALRKDILIPVTYFFRDPKLFAALRKKVSLLLMNKRSPQNPIRLWVPACSSGEEVYSLAIFLYEFLEERKLRPYIQIFGTDLSEALIEKARSGVYSQDIAAQVSAERLRRFFVKTEAGYKISKSIRDLCIFAKHDVTIDPPLSNMDIVSCRNLLIYLDTFLQNKALSMFHYALKPAGFLVLGTAESVTAVPGFFTAADKKQKIFSKNIVSRRTTLNARSAVSALATTKGKPRTMKNIAAPRNKPANPQNIASYKKAGKPKPAGRDESLAVNTDKDIVKLKKEFARTVERLHAISEEKDTVNEELKAANEEIQSSNEELQSMNEELETSKEELQSTNEELLTLNEELQNKNTELTHLNSDLSNVFSSTNIPIIIVGNDLRIKRFTPTARKVMNLIPTDVDRPIGDIKLNIDIANLEEMILGVIEDMIPKESEVMDKEGRWYSVRIRPYRTVDNKIDGAIIAMIDIDVIKRSREASEAGLNYTQAIVDTMREALVVLDKDLRVLSANKSFCDRFRIQETDIKTKLIYEISRRQWDNPELRKLLKEVLPNKSYFNDFELSFDFPDIGPKTLLLNGRQIKQQGKDSPLILLVIDDITKRKKAEDILKRDNATLDKLIEKRSKDLLSLREKLVRARHLSAIGTLAATVAHELRNPLADIAVSTHRIKKLIKDRAVERILNGINARVSESDQIITNILSYSKTAITHFEYVRINDILKGAVDEEARNLSSGKIAVNQKIDGTQALFIDADPARLKEVFRNVLRNAIDAVAAGTGRIEVETYVKKSLVFVRIKDNGEGIASQDLKNVAKPFFTTKAKGTGLGLAVSKQLVALHGGSITFSSVKGEGTTVAITLPVNRGKNES
ncbi:MAG: PAS domain-containing protein [Candidatus Omnitrophica bacterium]|nr:PAS domain-containing protein [Candidatus Omnitrophota bacterium]